MAAVVLLALTVKFKASTVLQAQKAMGLCVCWLSNVTTGM